MNSYFFPKIAMSYKVPQTILYGFFIRQHSLREPIDDVERDLSGIVCYQQILINSEGI